MKVFLFVQTGDARPKVLKRATKGYVKAAILDRCEAGRESWRTHNQIDRWWLVECDSPEDGRLLLAQLSIGESCRTVAGRIIARVLKEDDK